MTKNATSRFCRRLTLGAVAAALCACGGQSGDQDNANSGALTPPRVAAPGLRTVSGVVSKGPVSGAAISVFEADADGFKASDLPVAETVTDTAGNWSVTVDGAGGLLVVSAGGSYVDESDDQPDPANRRTVSLAPDVGFEAYLPAGAQATSLNAFTMSLMRRSRLTNPGGAFAGTFAENRAAVSTALGFDPVSVLPSDPIAPAATDSDASRQYAMALGGVANAINSLAIALGLEEPQFGVIDAVVDDLTDCAVDATGLSGSIVVEVDGAAVAAIAPQDLNAQILRFRNNNFDAYTNTSLVRVNAAACEVVVVTPDVEAPVFTQVPAPFVVNAVSAAGTPLASPAVAEVLATVAAVDNLPGPVAISNDAPATLPLGDTMINLLATDVAGNAAQAGVVVTVADLQAPDITAPADVVVTATGALTAVALGEVQAADNVSDSAGLFVANDAPVDGFPAGDTVVTWTVTDEAGLSGSDVQLVSVLPASPFLQTPIPDRMATEGQPFALDVGSFFADVDSALTFGIAGLPAGTGLALDPVSGLLEGIPQPVDVAASPLQLTVTASDGSASASDSFQLLIVGAANQPPGFSISGNIAQAEDFAGTQVITVIPDPVPVTEAAQVVTYSLVPAPDEVTLVDVSFDTQTGVVALSSLPDANGTQEFTLTANDGQPLDNTFSASFTVTVSAVNDPPAFSTSGDVVQFEDFPGTVTVAVTPEPVPADEAGQAVVYSLTGDVVDFAQVDIDSQSGVVSIQSLPNAVGAASLTIVADDGQADNGIFERGFLLTVESANDVPQVVSEIESQGATVGSEFTLPLAQNFSDVDDDELVFEMSNAPASFSLNPQTGVLSGVPVDLDALIRRFDIQVSAMDPGGASVDTVFDLFVGYPDRDADDLPDDDELIIGTNPDDPDTDGDGVGDSIEVDVNGDPLNAATAVFHVSPDGNNAASGLSWAEAKANNAGLPVIPPGASPDSPTYVLYAGNLDGLLASTDWSLVLTPPCDNIHLIGSQGQDDFATKLTPARGPATRFAGAGGTVLDIGACNNVVVRNIEVTGGSTGAVSVVAGSVRFEGVVIRDSLSLDAGAGLRVSGGAISLVDSSVSSNGSATLGGGVHATNGALLTVANSRFEGNAALGDGGAVYLESADASSSISNSWFVGNRAARGGAIALADNVGTELTNNTMRLNQADGEAAAVWFDGTGSGPVVRDSVLIDNRVAGLPSVFNAEFTAAMSSHNLLDAPVGGAGSINALVNAPQLTAAGFLDQALSPAVDAGSVTAAAAGLDGFFTDPSRFAPLTDTGLVDMGAHAARPYNGGADDYDEPLAVQDIVNLRPGLGPQPVIITPTRNGQPIGAGHQLIATTDNPAVAELLSVTSTDPLGNGNSVLLIDLGNGDYRFAADAGSEPGETPLTIFVDDELVERDPPVILRQCSPPVICQF